MRYLWRMAGTRDRVGALAGCVLLLGAVLGGCGSTTQSPKDAGDAASSDTMPGSDASNDSNRMCTYLLRQRYSLTLQKAGRTGDRRYAAGAGGVDGSQKESNSAAMTHPNRSGEAASSKPA